MKLLITFIILNILNVVIQTIKSIATIKCGKIIASIINAIAYGLYTVVLVYMVCDLSTFTKALIVALCNLVGVYVVKAIEEKTRKDKLWLVKMTISKEFQNEVIKALKSKNISFTELNTDGKYRVFDCYCDTQKDTAIVTNIAKTFNGKTFATENKLF